jgi:hypothetical protein
LVLIVWMGQRIAIVRRLPSVFGSSSARFHLWTESFAIQCNSGSLSQTYFPMEPLVTIKEYQQLLYDVGSDRR